MEFVYQGTAQGGTREAGGGKVTGAVSNSSYLCYTTLSVSFLLPFCFFSFSSCGFFLLPIMQRQAASVFTSPPSFLIPFHVPELMK